MSLIMPALTAPVPAPRGSNKKFFLAIILAFIVASFGAVIAKGFLGQSNVTVKPCATCTTCACKPLLGGPRCGCPK